MARGWESKSVESQMDEAASEFSEKHESLTPEQQHRERERQGLLLARTRAQQQLETATNERYAEQLRRSLAEIEARLDAAEKGDEYLRQRPLNLLKVTAQCLRSNSTPELSEPGA